MVKKTEVVPNIFGSFNLNNMFFLNETFFHQKHVVLFFGCPIWATHITNSHIYHPNICDLGTTYYHRLGHQPHFVTAGRGCPIATALGEVATTGRYFGSFFIDWVGGPKIPSNRILKGGW